MPKTRAFQETNRDQHEGHNEPAPPPLALRDAEKPKVALLNAKAASPSARQTEQGLAVGRRHFVNHHA
jgi:hypothetical protein